MTKKSLKLKEQFTDYSYERFLSINGQHPLKDSAPFSYVEYKVRKRKGGRVVYFNFELAKEMGLIPKNHPHILNDELCKVLLDTFAIVIINEYDMMNATPINKKEIKDHTYMATRYLQLQHPNKKGLTSGDGRSIWNGSLTHKGVTWDIASCGTGATCLSPATHLNNKFYQTGDPSISYGCGYFDLSDGFCTAVLSEIFSKNNVETERSLCIIEFENDLAINVRAAKNLLRPSHFFNHLKQNQYERLRDITDYYIDRQINNKDWVDAPKTQKGRYRYFLKKISETFAKIAAVFESNYIFCWLDWDGDNILTNGGIIDYGSVRQLGLFHHEYRYDDVERWSTTIVEQKNKAKYIVQTFTQLVDYLQSGEKKNIKQFTKDKALDEFEETFEKYMHLFLAQKIGFNNEEAEYLYNYQNEDLNSFRKVFSYFERQVSPTGKHKVPDGVTVDAIFCMRDILRELPWLLIEDYRPIETKRFLEIMKSNYATSSVVKPTESRVKKVTKFQTLYMNLIESIAKYQKIEALDVLVNITERSDVINRYDRLTGDATLYVAQKLMRDRKKLSSEELHTLITTFVYHNIGDPDSKYTEGKKIVETEELKKKAQNSLKGLLKIVKDFSEGL